MHHDSPDFAPPRRKRCAEGSRVGRNRGVRRRTKATLSIRPTDRLAVDIATKRRQVEQPGIAATHVDTTTMSSSPVPAASRNVVGRSDACPHLEAHAPFSSLGFFFSFAAPTHEPAAGQLPIERLQRKTVHRRGTSSATPTSERCAVTERCRATPPASRQNS